MMTNQYLATVFILILSIFIFVYMFESPNNAPHASQQIHSQALQLHKACRLYFHDKPRKSFTAYLHETTKIKSETIELEFGTYTNYYNIYHTPDKITIGAFIRNDAKKMFVYATTHEPKNISTIYLVNPNAKDDDKTVVRMIKYRNSPENLLYDTLTK